MDGGRRRAESDTLTTLLHPPLPSGRPALSPFASLELKLPPPQSKSQWCGKVEAQTVLPPSTPCTSAVALLPSPLLPLTSSSGPLLRHRHSSLAVHLPLRHIPCRPVSRSPTSTISVNSCPCSQTRPRYLQVQTTPNDTSRQTLLTGDA